MTTRDELESIYGGCTAFIRLQPPEKGVHWELAAGIAHEHGREICKVFSAVYDRTELKQMTRHIVFRPTGIPDVTLSLKEQDAVLARESIDEHFSADRSIVVCATVRRMFPLLFP